MNYEPSRPTSWLRSGLDVVDLMHSWLLGAPQVLTQPILPGWTFAINNVNSSAPATEAEIVAGNSYGRQLGRINDVLERLLQDHPNLQHAQEVKDFLEMKHEIDETKVKAAQDRLERILADLITVRNKKEGR